MKDITLLNLNMLFVRHFDHIEKELHVPLGPLYLIASLEKAGFSVDFRDYQLNEYNDPFSTEALLDMLKDPAEIIGISLMTNLLPFALIALEKVKKRYPDRTIVLGGVGPKSVEHAILELFPWIDVIAIGESEHSAPLLIRALQKGGGLAGVPGIVFRDDGRVTENPRLPRIEDPDTIPFPAFDHIDIKRYAGYGIIASRGCPYPCTFCSVAPIWDRRNYSRSAENIIAEMRMVHEKAGADLFLFQDEFFVSSKARILEFCKSLRKSRLPLQWKTFGRVDLTDEETMEDMARSGCLEIRYGIESASEKVLKRIKKGFTSNEAVAIVTDALRYFPRVDCFYVWGFPFETMEDFYQSVFQMVSLRAMGARVLPSLLSFLPQTDLYAEYRLSEAFAFCPDLFPEYMVTGHEICRGARVEITDQHRPIFKFISNHRDLFPGFFHYDLEGNILPKLKIMQEFGFYPGAGSEVKETESCGAHSPKVEAQFRSEKPCSPAAIATSAENK